MLPSVTVSDDRFMTMQIGVGETDDPYFIELLNRLIRALVIRVAPQQLWIIQIDNWFDHKWLRFSGIGTVDPVHS